MKGNKQSTTVSWMLWQKLKIKLVTGMRNRVNASSLRNMDVSSTYCETECLILILNQGKSVPLQPRGGQRVPGSLDSKITWQWPRMMVRLSDLSTGRIYPPGNAPGTRFFYRQRISTVEWKFCMYWEIFLIFKLKTNWLREFFITLYKVSVAETVRPILRGFMTGTHGPPLGYRYRTTAFLEHIYTVSYTLDCITSVQIKKTGRKIPLI
jgi:hypothetical protein